MYSEKNKTGFKTAAWRISLWGTLVFGCGALVVFVFLNYYVSNEIQARSDAWLKGEIEVLSDVAKHTPQNDLYDRILDEVAELATKEAPTDHDNNSDWNEAVFFLQTDAAHKAKIWVGKGESGPYLVSINSTRIVPGQPVNMSVSNALYPYRVVCYQAENGTRNYLGLSERNDARVLRRMRIFLIGICLLIVVLGFLLIFFTTKAMLRRVQLITETASRIGQNDLVSRVPEGQAQDEIAQLANTLNRMLDRIQATVRQLHTITDSLSHDLRSPMMAVRGKLETALLKVPEGEWIDPMAGALEELDRLSELLNKSLDVAEANVDALRLRLKVVQLDQMMQRMIDLYEPSFTERGMHLIFTAADPVMVELDGALMHRMLSNLLDNCLKHLPDGASILISLKQVEHQITLTITDNGSGFPSEILPRVFEKHIKGKQSSGSGLGLAFVEAVVRAHHGTITAMNQPGGGAKLEIQLVAIEAHAQE